MNVFVCEGRSLKLGDFGIVRPAERSAAGSRRARTEPVDGARATSWTGTVPKWQARDDVYQVGQLLGMLVKGDAQARIRSGEIRQLACSGPPEGDRLPLHRRAPQALRERRRADRGAHATRPRSPQAGQLLRSLKGVHLAFTGILSRPRREADGAARRAGAVRPRHALGAHDRASVRGQPNALQAAGREAGLKLMEIKRLRARRATASRCSTSRSSGGSPRRK